MNSILVVGAEGMLGRAWARVLAGRGVRHQGLDLPAFDVTDPAAVGALALDGFDAVVNCAAWTDVDGAEAEPGRAAAINGDAVGVLAARCRAAGCPLVHYSTDYVFDGRARTPYPVDAPTSPVNAYGEGKLLGERRLAEAGARWLLVRTSWLYAPWGQNFVRTISQLARERDRLRVVDDQTGRPTSAEHLARTSLELLRRGATGVFHVTDGGQCTWCELAREIARHVAPRCRVEPCTTAEFPRPAARPAYGVLDLSRVEALLGPMPSWKANLAGVMAELLGDDSVL